LTKSRGEKQFGPDKMGDKYSDPATSEIEISVGAGKPNDLGKIELEAEIVEPTK
jgi:hypothetical protein